MQRGRQGRLNPAVGFARGQVAQALNLLIGRGAVLASGKPAGRTRVGSTDSAPAGAGQRPLVLVACSGGPDSLALAALVAHFVRRQDIRAGAVVVDHGLQPGSAEVAATAQRECLRLGLTPVRVKTVSPDTGRLGLEEAARRARYTAFEEAARETGASAVLLGHTLDDQAETVLLGLARGSGTRSLAGMPTLRHRGGLCLLRPLLAVRREQVAEICAAEGLEPWHDPTNTDQHYMRARVRHSILPFLEEQLGGDVALSLARTAAILGADSSYLDSRAEEIFDSLLLPSGHAHEEMAARRLAGTEYAVIDRAQLSELDTALRRRVLALAITKVGGHNPVFERLSALDSFASEHGVAGPLQLSGHVSAWRVRPPGPYRQTGLLVVGKTEQKPRKPKK